MLRRGEGGKLSRGLTRSTSVFLVGVSGSTRRAGRDAGRGIITIHPLKNQQLGGSVPSPRIIGLDCEPSFTVFAIFFEDGVESDFTLNVAFTPKPF